ncbi:hypothetical protein KV205_25820 [Streptomyces sp. SKN60]|uniref:hypothetical protein n=1 Tax=Streptomyces sp. SKN60 TaxID=2855506 RepID=UPI002246ED1B|nr:hypothetical protein [Streptomyces sp. SKN60]MCX2183924.1 hypothetical protein [Streptomyces sp. SKN60]
METSYPVFEGGQTLRADDLNRLGSYHRDRERLLGLLAGFGINTGLTGAVEGSVALVQPGLCVDQAGEAHLVDAVIPVPLPPTAGPETFPFVDPAQGGFSVVLEGTDEPGQETDCDDPDCAGHAVPHTRSAKLRVVAGRVTGPRFDFGQEPLLAANPLTRDATPTAYATLREAIADRLTNSPGDVLISPAAITALRATSLESGDLPGVKAYKAGFLDHVLFAALDLLRISRLLATPTERTGVTRPGVVLGWLHLVGTQWVWDCEFRHAWEPPTGLVRSLLGGGCGDPAKRYRDAIEALIATYAPPNPPPSTGGGGTGPIVVVPDDFDFYPDGKGTIYVPPKVFPEVWPPEILIRPIDPLWDPPDYPERFEEIVKEVYRQETFTFFGTGVIDQTATLGRPAETVRPILAERLTELSGSANVVTVTQSEAEDLAGFEPAGNLNVADTAVLVTNSQGTVVATGRIPAAHSAREIGTRLPEATAKAEQAIALSTGHQESIGALTATVTEFSGQIEDFTAFTVTATEKFATLTDGLAHLGEAQEKITPLVDTLHSRLGEVEGLTKNLQGAVTTLTSVAGRAGGAAAGGRLGAESGRSLVGFAGLVTEGLKQLVTPDNEQTLGRYVASATKAAAALDVVTATGGEAEIGTATVALLGTMRSAIKAAGIAPEQARAIDAQFQVVKGLL